MACGVLSLKIHLPVAGLTPKPPQRLGILLVRPAILFGSPEAGATPLNTPSGLAVNMIGSRGSLTPANVVPSSKEII